MSFESTAPTPPGWYPDPSGEPQWRVWTGTAWSTLTRPYGLSKRHAPIAEHLGTLRALRRVTRLGVAALVVGTALLVSVLAYWPGHHDAVPRWFADAATTAAVALLVISWVIYADAARVFIGRWALWALLPGVNVLMVTGYTTQRLGGRVAPRVIATTLFLTLYVWQFHLDTWLCVVPVFVLFDQYRWTQAVVDLLSGRANEGEAPS